MLKLAIGRSLRSMATTTKTPPVLLCADFDETITQRDTTALLFQLASSSAATQQQLVEQYVDEVGGYLRRHEAKWLQRQTTGEFDGDGLREFLEGYAATDLRSLQRVVETRALRGIKQTDLVEAAESVQVRVGCVETLAIADRLAVISANWSGELVRTVLQRSGIATQSTEIIANGESG
ncbi:unnamed protein product [Phytophthora lilii]|uniref:Unnamed protein product n=1 Tax=Phytophthora lilii TaxID=2077276 RepID=A0A9W6TEV9_9STRA|nr:unnamed protein product [Phytophthora lilii]